MRATQLAVLRFALVLVAGLASAYVLPASSILRRMSEARDEVQFSGLKLDGTLTFSSSAIREAIAALGGGNRSELQVDAILLLKLPGRCRLEASTPEGARTVAVWTRGKERTEGTAIPELGAVLEQICPLLAVRSSSEAETRAAVERHLRSLKVDVRATSLGRLGGQIAYVLGNSADGQPQFWVYKDTFLPARIRWSDGERNGWDLRFLDYGSPVSGESFPRVFELHHNAELALRFTALKSDSRAPLPDKLF